MTCSNDSENGLEWRAIASTKGLELKACTSKPRHLRWSCQVTRGLARKASTAKLARLHARIANIRSDALHPLTSDLRRRFYTIVIEDLNVQGMMVGRRLARSIADMDLSVVADIDKLLMPSTRRYFICSRLSTSTNTYTPMSERGRIYLSSPGRSCGCLSNR
ncbi:transposase [Thermochromatium tepidum]|uniref:transposase n=1 Tax=Thermochromatium tepidum TaxID=1050 RepID=UPI003CCCA853